MQLINNPFFILGALLAVQTSFENTFQLTEMTIAYIKSMLRNSRNRYTGKVKTAKSLLELLGEKPGNQFIEWLSPQIGFGDVNEFHTFMEWAEKDPKDCYQPQGRCRITSKQAQLINDFWKEHCIISVDRRNDRNRVRIKPTKVHPLVRDLIDDNVEHTEKNKLQAHRYIYTKPLRDLHKKFIAKYHYISLTMFYQLKPFYICVPTDREKESCLCIDCLNMHNLLNVLHQHRPDVFVGTSVSKFFSCKFSCINDYNLSFPTVECINSLCKKKCTLNTGDLTLDIKKLHSFYLFERVPTTYYNLPGKEVTYIQTTRVDKKETLSEVYDRLRNQAHNYMIHRHAVVSDKVFWSYFPYSYIHLDYGENIALQPKFEAQSAHFSGKQQMLHNIVNEHVNGRSYIYHLSDDTNKGSILTFEILRDAIARDPSIIENKRLVVKSDNCPAQYKSKYVFQNMLDLAAELDVEFFWFYGEKGHGKGLVDAMSSFGCKKVLRSAIINEDLWFPNASAMVGYLNNYFKDDPSKNHFLIDEQVTAKLREQPRRGHKITDCKKIYCIAFNQYGECMTREHLNIKDESIFKLKFKAGYENEDDDDDSDVDDVNSDNHGEDLVNDNIEEVMEYEARNLILFEIITPDSYIGLRSPPESLELFFAAKVVSKDIATDYIEDTNGHGILPGEHDVTVQYLEKDKESFSQVQYKLVKKG